MPRSLYKLSAIETRHVYIVNTYKVYNNKNSIELRTYMSGSRGGGVEGYQYCQSSQLKLKNRRLKSNNKCLHACVYHEATMPRLVKNNNIYFCISVFLYKALRPYKHTGIFVRSILSTLVLSRGIWWCAYCNYWHEGRVAKRLVSATKVSNSDNINVLHSL